MMRSKKKLKRFLKQWDLDHAEQGGLKGVIYKLAKEAGRKGVISDEIIDRLFPDLPAEERAVLGGILEHYLTKLQHERPIVKALPKEGEGNTGHSTQRNRKEQDAKAFVTALARMTPKERAAAWRKLTPEECAAAWTTLTPEEREADTAALAVAYIK
jgi:hypothetical protein